MWLTRIVKLAWVRCWEVALSSSRRTMKKFTKKTGDNAFVGDRLRIRDGLIYV